LYSDDILKRITAVEQQLLIDRQTHDNGIYYSSMASQDNKN